MAKNTNPRWKNPLTKTKYACVYELIADDTTKQYIVRFSYQGKNYGERNFSNLFGVRTAKQAHDKLQEVKVDIAKYGNNPFQKKVKTTLEEYFKEFIKTKKNKVKYGDKYNTESTYNKFLKDTLGPKDIDEISKEKIEAILNEDMKGLSSRRKIDIKNILKPIFSMAVEDEIIKKSPLDRIKFEKVATKKEITSRVVTDLDEVVIAIYDSIIELKDIENRVGLLIALMTARRRGEILRLEYSNIKDDKVFVPASHTKTAIDDEYPLPIEIQDLIKQLPTYKKREGKIFTIKVQRLTLQFNYIIKDLVKKKQIELTEGSTITLHDTRNLFASIMSPLTNNPPLVDRCLSHSQTSMMTRYMSFGYSDRKEVFEKYWEVIRGRWSKAK